MIHFRGGVSSPDGFAFRPLSSITPGGAPSLTLAADVGGFLSVQVAVGLMKQLWKPSDVLGQLSSKKGTVDFVANNVWRSELEEYGLNLSRRNRCGRFKLGCVCTESKELITHSILSSKLSDCPENTFSLPAVEPHHPSVPFIPRYPLRHNKWNNQVKMNF